MESLYKIEKIEKKGLGWIATKDIKSGTLIAKEKPQFILKKYPKGMQVQIIKNDELVAFKGSLTLLPTLMESYDAMTKNDQEEFLKLNDSYSNFTSCNGNLLWYDEKRPGWPKVNRERAENYMNWKHYVEEVGEYFDGNLLFKLWCIYDSNHFQGDDSICFEISRLNHSCR